MKRKLFYLLSTLVVLSMFLGACASPATEAPKIDRAPKAHGGTGTYKGS